LLTTLTENGLSGFAAESRTGLGQAAGAMGFVPTKRARPQRLFCEHRPEQGPGELVRRILFFRLNKIDRLCYHTFDLSGIHVLEKNNHKKNKALNQEKQI